MEMVIFLIEKDNITANDERKVIFGRTRKNLVLVFVEPKRKNFRSSALQKLAKTLTKD